MAGLTAEVPVAAILGAEAIGFLSGEALMAAVLDAVAGMIVLGPGFGLGDALAFFCGESAIICFRFFAAASRFATSASRAF